MTFSIPIPSFDSLPWGHKSGTEVHAYDPTYSLRSESITVDLETVSTAKRELLTGLGGRTRFAETADTTLRRAHRSVGGAGIRLASAIRDGWCELAVSSQVVRAREDAVLALLDQASGVNSATSISSNLWTTDFPDLFLGALWANPDEAASALFENIRAGDFDDAGRETRKYVEDFLTAFGHAGTAILKRRSAELAGIGVDAIAPALDSIVEFAPSSSRGEVLSLLGSMLANERASVRDAASVALFALGGKDAASLVARALASETVKQVTSNMQSILNAME